MEKLAMAREMLKSGAGDDALDFAKAAETEVNKLTEGPAPARPSVKKKRKMA
jgi:hypothetical protein